MSVDLASGAHKGQDEAQTAGVRETIKGKKKRLQHEMHILQQVSATKVALKLLEHLSPGTAKGPAIVAG